MYNLITVNDALWRHARSDQILRWFFFAVVSLNEVSTQEKWIYPSWQKEMIKLWVGVCHHIINPIPVFMTGIQIISRSEKKAT